MRNLDMSSGAQERPTHSLVVNQQALAEAIAFAKTGASNDDLVDLQSVVALLPVRGVAQRIQLEG